MANTVWQTLQSWFERPREAVPVLAATVVLILAAVFVLWRWYRRQESKRVARIVCRLGCECVSDVMVPDGLDGHIHLDYLLLTSNGFVVIDTKDYKGMIFGGEKTDNWTQVVGSHSYRFPNPLHQNQARVTAVKALVGDVPVRGLVVFADEAYFPRETPRNVYPLDKLRREPQLLGPASDIPLRARLGWQKIKQVAQRAA